MRVERHETIGTISVISSRPHAVVLAEPLRSLAQFLGLANELVPPAWVRVEVRLDPQQQARVDQRLDVVRPQLQRAFDGFGPFAAISCLLAVDNLKSRNAFSQ